MHDNNNNNNNTPQPTSNTHRKSMTRPASCTALLRYGGVKDNAALSHFRSFTQNVLQSKLVNNHCGPTPTRGRGGGEQGWHGAGLSTPIPHPNHMQAER